MPAIHEEELVPGLVVQLDTSRLRQLGNSRTNAEKTRSEDRAVIGPHSFVVVATNPEDRSAILCPVFSQWAPGSLKLQEAKKSGFLNNWASVELHFSKWQHWEIPYDDIIACSDIENTQHGARRHYAAENAETLNSILRRMSRSPWIFVTAVPV